MSPVSEHRQSATQPAHFVCVSDSRSSLSTTQPSWFQAQIRQRGCPRASCCHSFSSLSQENIQDTKKKKKTTTKKQNKDAWIPYYLCMGGWRGSSVQMSLKPTLCRPSALPWRHNNSGVDLIHATQSSVVAWHAMHDPFNRHVSRVSTSVTL